MKKPLIFVLLLFVALTSYAQDYKANIEKRFNEYYTLVVKGEFEQSMAYIPDEFFKIIPKPQMVSLMKQLMNSKEFEAKITQGKIKSIKDSKLVAGKHYALFNYNNSMSMRFTSLDSLADRNERLQQIKQAFEMRFGADHVKLDSQTGTFSVDMLKKSCAISSNGLTDWKFVNIETEQKGILEKILPAEVINEL